MKNIPAQRIIFSKEDREEILSRIDDCLESGQIAQGESVIHFEEYFAKTVGAKHAIAVSSGGAALELAMYVLNVQGKKVLVPTNTFIATASAVRFAGGIPHLVDISPNSFAPSLQQIKQSRTPDTVGVIIVHIGGVITPEIEVIREYCRSTSLWLVEDCAHAHGSQFNDKSAGTFGVLGAYSFFSTKVVTSGEGGMVVTDNDDLATRIRCLRDYGKLEQWTSYSVEFGVNRRMSEFCAAVGLVHSRHLSEFVNQREEIAKLYAKTLIESTECYPIIFEHQSSWYKFIVLLPIGVSREVLRKRMHSKGIHLAGGVYELPLHAQPPFKNVQGQFPFADDLCSRHICLPIYPGMQTDEVRYVIQGLQDSLVEAAI